MKKNLSESLASSLSKERAHIKTLNLSKFDIADQALKEKKRKKVTTIRDTFTLPENDYILIDACKKKLLAKEISATKSEVIRLGLKIIGKMSEEELKKSFALIDKLKTGRPKKS